MFHRFVAISIFTLLVALPACGLMSSSEASFGPEFDPIGVMPSTETSFGPEFDPIGVSPSAETSFGPAFDAIG